MITHSLTISSILLLTILSILLLAQVGFFQNTNKETKPTKSTAPIQSNFFGLTLNAEISDKKISDKLNIPLSGLYYYDNSEVNHRHISIEKEIEFGGVLWDCIELIIDNNKLNGIIFTLEQPKHLDGDEVQKWETTLTDVKGKLSSMLHSKYGEPNPNRDETWNDGENMVSIGINTINTSHQKQSSELTLSYFSKNYLDRNRERAVDEL